MSILPPSLRERRIFVDTSAYLALLDLDDEHHANAVSIVTQLAEHRYRHFTTNVLLIEAHALPPTKWRWARRSGGRELDIAETELPIAAGDQKIPIRTDGLDDQGSSGRRLKVKVLSGKARSKRERLGGLTNRHSGSLGSLG